MLIDTTVYNMPSNRGNFKKISDGERAMHMGTKFAVQSYINPENIKPISSSIFRCTDHAC